MFTLFRSSPVRHTAELAYGRVVEYARHPRFFAEGGVPDTVDGRFELICLHAFLYLRRLKREQPGSAALGQLFVDTMFADFDRSLREMGTGDLSVGRQIKRMAEGFYGRVAAYDDGLDGDDAALAGALGRNVFGTASPEAERVAALVGYVRREAAALDRQDARALLAGQVRFGEPIRPEPQPASMAAAP
jgi:cytochrome b pre-mRNA-processing protein 3